MPESVISVMFLIRFLSQSGVDGRRAMGRTFPRPARTVLLLPLAALLIGGCAPRADIDPDPAAVDARQIVPVYVGTTRVRVPGAL
jgi:hypothetical protein